MIETNLVSCPACKKPLPIKGIPKHVSGCKSWAEKIGSSPSEFNWDLYFKRGPYADGLVEGTDWVRCQVCFSLGKDLRFRRMMDHLKKIHALTEESYHALHPGAPVRVAETAQRRETTVRTRYGVENVFQAAEVKGTIRDSMIRNHGAPSPLQVPSLRAKVAATNRERRGVENPFASEGVKAKIRETNLEKYGVENPNQSPEVIARRIETNRQRYGVDHYFTRPGYPEEYQASSLERFGATHPMKSDEGKSLCFASIQETYGVDSVFQIPEVQRRAYLTNLANHGGQHSQTRPEVLAKARETWLEKYGTDNPAKVEAVKARIKEVWVGKYGVPFPPQSLWTNRDQSFPNGLEKSVLALLPAYVVYAGDGSYWVRHKGASRARNPDFVILSPEQLEAYRAGALLNDQRVYGVIEAFGDYWHGPEKTGKSREEHAEEVLSYYQKAGLTCLILWEGDLKKHPQQEGVKIRKFLSRLVSDGSA